MNEPPASPSPSSTPPVSADCAPVVLSAIRIAPGTYSAPPTASTRPDP